VTEPPLPAFDVPEPRKPPQVGRRLLGVLLGLAVETTLCVATAAALQATLGEPASLFFGLVQIVPAIPLAVLFWRRDMKGTALSLAVSSAIVFLLIGGGFLALWIVCGRAAGH
jgi:hypothetical protein